MWGKKTPDEEWSLYRLTISINFSLSSLFCNMPLQAMYCVSRVYNWNTDMVCDVKDINWIQIDGFWFPEILFKNKNHQPGCPSAMLEHDVSDDTDCGVLRLQSDKLFYECWAHG